MATSTVARSHYYRQPCTLGIFLVILIVIILLCQPAEANPLLLSYYRRQQCEQQFQVCRMHAQGELPSARAGSSCARSAQAVSGPVIALLIN